MRIFDRIKRMTGNLGYCIFRKCNLLSNFTTTTSQHTYMVFLLHIGCINRYMYIYAISPLWRIWCVWVQNFLSSQGRRGENNASVNTFWMASTQQVETQAILKKTIACKPLHRKAKKESWFGWCLLPTFHNLDPGIFWDISLCFLFIFYPCFLYISLNAVYTNYL